MDENKPIRFIIDTNLWISFIISNKLNKLDSYLFSNEIQLIFSSELIEELKLTIVKPKLKKYFRNNSIEEILLKFDPYIEFVEPLSAVTVCRDPKDDFLLALAKDAKANFLITGDKDLLSLKVLEQTKILTFTEFIQLLK